MLSVYAVDSLEDTVANDGLTTLREALEAANTNTALWGNAIPAGSDSEADVIQFAEHLFTDGTNPVPGTITFAPGNGQLEVTDPAGTNIQGPGPDLLTINANRQDRVFFATAGDAALSGMTLTGGLANTGGGIAAQRNLLNVANVVISGNEVSGGGGGIACNKLNVSNSTLSNNQARHGGAIYISGGGTATINDCTFQYNTAEDEGGGIADFSNSTLTVNRCSFEHNTTGDWGGGVYSESNGLKIVDSYFAHNSAYRGGGIGTGYSVRNALIRESTIVGNSAEMDGGGIHIGGRVTVANSAIVGNSAGRNGGGIGNADAWITVVNSTITANRAGEKGGGFYGFSDAIANSIVSLNESATDPDVSIYSPSGVVYSLVGTDPAFVRNAGPGDDGIWGTPDDDYGDLRLSAASTAINAGSNALAVDAAGNPLLTDLDGGPRIVDATVDIGAYEFIEYLLPGDANCDGTVDAGDAAILANYWGLSGMQWSNGDFNDDGIVGPIDACILAAHFGKTVAMSGERLIVEPNPIDDTAFIGPLPASAQLAPRQLIAPAVRRGERSRLIVAASAEETSAACNAVMAEQNGTELEREHPQHRALAWSETVSRRQIRTQFRENDTLWAIDLLLATR